MPDYKNTVGKLNRINLVRKIRINRLIGAKKLYFGQFPIIDFIIKNPGCTQKDIAEFIKVTPASVALSLKRMQKSDLIKRETDSEDPRKNRIYITDFGKQMADECRSIFDKTDKEMFAGFSDKEISQLESYLSRILDNLSDNEMDTSSFFSLVALAKEENVFLNKENGEK